MKNEEAILREHVIGPVICEYYSAVKSHKPFSSSHEGYAVIKEELDELWEEIRKKESGRDTIAMKKEAIQIAAMAIRFVVDVC